MLFLWKGEPQDGAVAPGSYSNAWDWLPLRLLSGHGVSRRVVCCERQA
ncbi:hypothetical protein CSUI_011173 [Cystoisospora suis]|uniref:Uncharacterized protein n=1 Tax=Cystoisospora suis TaxID=483139 RepID=A0A2C6KFB0_9APIC|nr:hypothetical protein CSUI_011173 [Cystoisospora suis]